MCVIFPELCVSFSSFLHKPSVLLHSVCSFTHIYYLLCPINHDLRYFVAKSVCRNLRAFRCKFFLQKSCLCKRNDKYQVWTYMEIIAVLQFGVELERLVRWMNITRTLSSKLWKSQPLQNYLVLLHDLQVFAQIVTAELA